MNHRTGSTASVAGGSRAPAPARRLGGWGFEGTLFEPSAELLAWLHERIGSAPPGEPTVPFPSFDPATLRAGPGHALPDGLAPSTDALDRLAHARGQGINDLLRVRSGTLPALPDAVLRPESAAEVEAILHDAAREGVRVIPWGGGTSVTGGVTVVPDEAPVVSLDLARLSGLEALDEISGLATFGAGTAGPALEHALAEHGWTLGHFPQSFELSTLGGWIVTRASGQESLGYGSIQDLVAGLELVAPTGRLELPALPASAAGPDLRQLVLGSEGRLGIVRRATLRVRRRPETLRVTGTLMPSWDAGLAAARTLVQQGVPLTLLRLSDEPETEVAMSVGLGGAAWVRPLLRGYLRLRGVGRSPRGGWGCLMLIGAAGAEAAVSEALDGATAILRRHGGVSLGERPGHTWVRDRFRHPYLRDALLDRGVATDTLETAAPWARVPEVAIAVRRALEDALPAAGEDERVAVLCHVSHPYRDGSSLYFTFFFRCPPDADRAVARWATLKRAATTALVEAGATLSHHHGVGSVHAPWLGREVGEQGLRLLAASAAALDPDGVLNPHTLLDPTDHLEI